MPASVHLNVAEKDVVKAILEFLESRGLHIAQLSLERETGIINGDFSDDVLFLRQLVLDGQWDNALDFVEPLKDLPDFDLRAFRYNVTKYKYFELLCIKQEPGPLHDNDFTVELSLERETGIINGDFSDDVLFLRQLVLDGQWDNALDFVEPLKDLPDFDLRAFRYNVTKYKYFELLCIKQEPGPLHDNDFTVETVCFRRLGEARDFEVVGEAWDFEVVGETRNSEVVGEARDFEVVGEAWDFEVVGETRNSEVVGEARDFEVVGEAWDFEVVGETRNSEVVGEARDFEVVGEAWDFEVVEETRNSEVELVECLKDLEHICPSPEDFRGLCALLTLPKLSDHVDFKNWNPSSARVECFRKLEAMVSPLLPSTKKSTNTDTLEAHAINDRLIQLILKGAFYEGCVDYCQAQAINDKQGAEKGAQPSNVLATRPRISSTDLSLVSWLESIGLEQFTLPFQQKTLDLKLEHIKKPKLEAQWTEQILATPIKPGGVFPHALVPNAKLKFAQKMSQSLVLPAKAGSSMD
ncbi:WD repeat-containing protein 47 [Toxocara canis]|uniref:WD repeat-containing protein 47 n=1 Tax=Toxocara canis TaxID=6265 RepID=A0A0B2VYM4_TOXCA|nr:WD repeat-containing protein 47 [Toxocara canis]